jgi:NADH:ubiquinone oxidoreductase subunit
MFSKRISIILLLLCSCGSLLEAQEKSTTQPTTQTTKANTGTAVDPAGSPEFEAGRAAAKTDLEAGILGEILAVPETFLRQWMNPYNKDANLLSYYQAIVEDRYGVKSRWVMFNSASPGRRQEAAGYNKAMRATIEKRIGVDMLDKAWKEACEETTEKRAKYLKLRKENAEHGPKATTQETSPSTTRPASTNIPANK